MSKIKPNQEKLKSDRINSLPKIEDHPNYSALDDLLKRISSGTFCLDFARTDFY
jgi:uncharacterized membrane protein YfbV (UPF0208 family)